MKPLALSLSPLSLGLYAVVALGGCGQDIKVAEASRCDGVLQGQEETVDSPFDADQDGYFDGANPDCQATYEAAALDCNDRDDAIRPGAVEVTCNAVDDDCDAATPDAPDADGDGFDACADCADALPDINPSVVEVVCDGYDNDCNDATEDEQDDDGDGYGSCSDCADGNADVNPGLPEITCNGIDDDCSDATPDGVDADGDGSSACAGVDCDDLDATRAPTYAEICDDGIDNDCDLEVDDGCTVDYTGRYTLDRTVSYSCAFGLVSLNVSSLTVVDVRPVISFSSGGTAPGTMTGTIDASDAFTTENVLSGSCTETYAFDGSFVSADHYTGTLTATYTGGRACFDCSDQSWTVDGYR